MRCGLLRVHRKAFRTFNFGPENESESELCPSLSLSLSLSPLLLTGALYGGGCVVLEFPHIEEESERVQKNFVKVFIWGQKSGEGTATTVTIHLMIPVIVCWDFFKPGFIHEGFVI